MLSFRIYRNSSDTPAADFDLGDIEFIFDEKTVSSCGNSRFSSMIYISISSLIDGLLKIKNDAKIYEFVGVDSSFVIKFEKTKNGIYARHKKNNYGPFVLRELLMAINSGIENFISNPRNQLPPCTAASIDFNGSWSDLKVALSQYWFNEIRGRLKT